MFLHETITFCQSCHVLYGKFHDNQSKLHETRRKQDTMASLHDSIKLLGLRHGEILTINISMHTLRRFFKMHGVVIVGRIND